MEHKRIIIELLEDEKSGGYTIISDDIHNGAVIAEGDNIVDALENFKNTLIDIEQYLKEEDKNG